MENFAQTLKTARNSDHYWFGRVKLHAAAQLQDLLASSGMNQEQYAAQLGVKPPQVSRVLNGLGNPTLETLVKMGRALGYVPRVAFVQDTAQAPKFDAQTDEADVQLDIHYEKVESVSNVLSFRMHRQSALKRAHVPPPLTQLQSTEFTLPLAA